jgi:hypothetical protein
MIKKIIYKKLNLRLKSANVGFELIKFQKAKGEKTDYKKKNGIDDEN